MYYRPHSRDLVLRLVSFFDRTAYRCRWCGRIARGLAPRVFLGWTCSESCSNHYIEAVRKLREGQVASDLIPRY